MIRLGFRRAPAFGHIHHRGDLHNRLLCWGCLALSILLCWRILPMIFASWEHSSQKEQLASFLIKVEELEAAQICVATDTALLAGKLTTRNAWVQRKNNSAVHLLHAMEAARPNGIRMPVLEVSEQEGRMELEAASLNQAMPFVNALSTGKNGRLTVLERRSDGLRLQYSWSEQ